MRWVCTVPRENLRLIRDGVQRQALDAPVSDESEVAVLMSDEPPVDLGVRYFGGWVFWRPQRQGDGGVEELERLALSVGGFGEQRNGGGGCVKRTRSLVRVPRWEESAW